jgi:hypothetical protein
MKMKKATNWYELKRTPMALIRLEFVAFVANFLYQNAKILLLLYVVAIPKCCYIPQVAMPAAPSHQGCGWKLKGESAG